MTTHDLTLEGCTSTPLAHYLKALAILRLVSEQADPTARGSWRGGVFRLRSRLDAQALEHFFLHDYKPTPLVSPWNGGSGFFPKDNKEALEAIESSTAARFAPYAEAIREARKLTVGLEESPKDEAKVRMLAAARNTWRDGALQWLMAASVLSGEDWFQFPALLGTGGNDGRFDFTKNFMERLTEVLDTGTGAPRQGADKLLEASLFGAAAMGLASAAVGQFLPGGAGGVNSSAGFSGNALVNRWDFILLLEGAIALRVAAVRRLDARGLPQAAAPFAVRAHAAGYASASPTDESARGEQWMPMWDGLARWSEVRALFDEARLQLGTTRSETALDAARAIARVGVARGISAFERFGYIERNGQANLAVPLGRWSVARQPNVEILDDVVPWTEKLRRASAAKGAPLTLGHHVRVIESAMLAVCRDARTSTRWKALVVSLAEAELALVKRPKFTAENHLSPLPALNPGWLEALGDTPEVRIAAAIASQAAPHQDKHLGPIRVHVLPLAGPRFEVFARGESGLARDPRVVWTGGDPVTGMARVVSRRVIDALGTTEGFGLDARRTAPVDDVEAFVTGRVDDVLIGALTRGLMALRWNEVDQRDSTADARPSQPLLALFRLLHLDHDLEEIRARPEPTVARLLASGRLSDATTFAIRRLRARGVAPKLRLGAGRPELAIRLGAAMAIPLARPTLSAMARLVAKPADTRTWVDEVDPGPPLSSTDPSKE